GEKEWRRTIASTAMKPILCRFWAYLGPGFPRPTSRIIARAPPVAPDYFLPPAGALAAAAAGAAPLAPAAAAGSAAVASAEVTAAGATTVATVKSRSVMVGFTPAGSFTLEIWIDEPIS